MGNPTFCTIVLPKPFCLFFYGGATWAPSRMIDVGVAFSHRISGITSAMGRNPCAKSAWPPPRPPRVASISLITWCAGGMLLWLPVQQAI